MSSKIKLRRGVKANLPTSSLEVGEPLFTTDRGTLHVPIDGTTKLPVVPAIEDLNTIPSIDVSNDLLIIQDVSETTGQKEKKATVQALKTALNIPAASTDEKVAVVSGGASGYLFGTNGTDGVLRVSNAMTITKDSGNAYMTLDVTAIDGGTF